MPLHQSLTELMRLSCLEEQRRAGFERLLSGLSAALADLSSEAFDQSLESCLKRLAQCAGVERVTIAEFPQNGRELRTTHAFAQTGYQPFPHVLVDAPLPWYSEQIRRGRVLRYERLPEGLPPEAAREAAYCLQSGLKAHLSIPLKSGGSVVGVLAFGSFRAEHSWSDEIVLRLRLIGEVIANALARKWAQQRFRAVVEGLRESQRRLQLMADSLPVLICYVDAERRYQFNNAAYASWLGIPAEACKGRPLRDVLGAVAYEAIAQHVDAALAGQPQAFDTGLTYREGGARYVHALYVPHRDDDGKVLGFYALILDMTERKRADAEAQALREQLAHVARVATMGELAASIAHEVSQPLCAIQSNAQTAHRLLAKPVPDLEEIREALQDIVEDGRRASEVLARIRSFLQKDQFKRVRLDINNLVRDVVPLARREMTKRDTVIELNLTDGLPPVLGDTVQLQQVLLNLITNALEAMDGVERPRRRLQIGSSQDPSGKIVVAVTDNGMGLRAADEGRLFEAFFTTKRRGLGMGLAICRSIIEAHGGRLWATPNTGPGATFHFTLPSALEVHHE